MTQLATYVFINYANADEVFAMRLYDDLHKLGQTAWIDRRDITNGQHWNQAITRALHSCTHMALVWSRHAEESREVESEWIHFSKLNKPIIVVQLDDTPIPFQLENAISTDFSRDYAGGLRQLLNHLKSPQRNPEAALLLFEQGNTSFDSFDYTNAIKAYSRALSLDPTNAAAYFSRGMCYHKLGHYERALEDYAESIRLDGSNYDAHFNQGLLFRIQGKHGRALVSFSEAIRNAPNRARLHQSHRTRFR